MDNKASGVTYWGNHTVPTHTQSGPPRQCRFGSIERPGRHNTHALSLEHGLGDRETSPVQHVAIVPMVAFGETQGPRAIQYLVTLERQDGNLSEALRHLDRAIAHLQKFPLGGTSVRLLEQRLVELRDTIPRE